MADEAAYQHHHHEAKVEDPCETAIPKVDEYAAVEASDRGLFGHKKEEKKCEEEEAAFAAEFEQDIQICPDKKEEYGAAEEKKHQGLIAKLHRSNSSSSSVSANYHPIYTLFPFLRTF